MGRFMDWVLGATPTLVADSTTVIPSWGGGDRSQIASLPVAIAEAFGINPSSESVTRAEAMKIPTVKRGRQVIAGTLGAASLVATRTRAGNPPERITISLLNQPDPNATRQYTLTWTIDSLIFYGVAWWRILKRNAFNFPEQAEWISPSRIVVSPSTGEIRIDGEVVTNPEKHLIRFDGPDEGILFSGAVTLKTALLLEAAVRRYARLDIPLGFLQDEEGTLEEDETQELLNAWEAARIKRSTGYLPKGLKYVNPMFNAEQLQLGDARNFQSQEIARLMNLPASTVNAPTNDSLTYSTTESNRRELVDMTFAPYQQAIEQRLSMGDVTPNGTVVAFDLGKFLRGDMKTVVETGAAAVREGLMTVDEVRTEWLNLPPMSKEVSDGGDA